MSTIAWHFVGDTLRDGRPIPPDGEWLTHEGKVKICESGLHASERLADALRYSPGSMVCRVQCEAIVEREHDKLVCRRRRILWRVECDSLLSDFARWCAWRVLHLWAPPDVVRRYLLTGAPYLRSAARDGARDAARAAPRHGARDAARYAAWAAALDAAWAAARYAALDAATDAAKAAAWDAAKDGARDGAKAAAWAAALAAAWDEQNAWLTDAVERLHRGEYQQWKPDAEGGGE